MNAKQELIDYLYLPIIIIAIFFLWNTSFIYPLKILVVFFHEASHALMTILTGGTVGEMVVNVNQGGHVMSGGGSRFLTLSAGYLGSLLWGAVIYLAALKSRHDEIISGLLGLILIAITVIFVRNGFGFGFGIATGVAMIALGTYGNEFINDLMLRVIGVTSMIYAPLDIYSDTISRSHLRSDARMLAEEFGGATIMWGGIWIVVSAIILYYVVRAKGNTVSKPQKSFKKYGNTSRYARTVNRRR